MDVTTMGIVFFAAAALVIFVYFKRKNDRRDPTHTKPRSPAPPIEQQKEKFDEAWKRMIEAGMDPEGGQAKAFIISVRKSLGWNWNPPEKTE
jgi:hypothetical protein